MYFPKTDDHDAWLERVKKNQEVCRKKRDKKATAPSPSTSDNPSGANGNSGFTTKLMLNNNLKAILCTNCTMSEEQ
eukprot:7038756-Ditylum_brightwellii.AAC.1